MGVRPAGGQIVPQQGRAGQRAPSPGRRPDGEGVAVRRAGEALVDPGELLDAVVESPLQHGAVAAVDGPPPQGGVGLGGVQRVAVEDPLVADHVDDGEVALLVGVDRVEDEAGVDLQPQHVGVGAVARQQAEPGAVVVVPGVGHPRPGGGRCRVEGDRQVVERSRGGR